MVTLTKQKIVKIENVCDKILKNKDVRYICLINKMGRLIVEKKQKKVDFLISEKNSKALYMKLKLESALIKDFDESLGKLEYIIVTREKIQMISIPMYSYVVMISVKRNTNSKAIANVTRKLIEKTIR